MSASSPDIVRVTFLRATCTHPLSKRTACMVYPRFWLRLCVSTGAIARSAYGGPLGLNLPSSSSSHDVAHAGDTPTKSSLGERELVTPTTFGGRPKCRPIDGLMVRPWYLTMTAVVEQFYDALNVWAKQGDGHLSRVHFKQFRHGHRRRQLLVRLGHLQESRLSVQGLRGRLECRQRQVHALGR
ncbi:hypothetical protein C8Q80DRAFT_1195231 [Daedaleopsis nitida]|nr:hypothetical protein C8Q80DRAFT_1195231 [Daedaleopsis nitida]